jgi:hypothetical protein
MSNDERKLMMKYSTADRLYMKYDKCSHLEKRQNDDGDAKVSDERMRKEMCELKSSGWQKFG